MSRAVLYHTRRCEILHTLLNGTDDIGNNCHWATSLYDLTFAEPIRWAKVRSKYLFKPKSEVISLSESLMCQSMV